MSIKAILVPVRGIEHDIHALRSAIRLAQAHDAHVTALFSQPSEEDLASTWAGYGMVAPPASLLDEMDRETKLRAQRVGTLLKRAAREAGAPIVPAGQEQEPPFSVSLRTDKVCSMHWCWWLRHAYWVMCGKR